MCGAMHTQISHRPYGRPETGHITHAWKHDRGFDQSSCEAKFVPRRHESSLIVQSMRWSIRERDFQGAVFGCYRSGVIPLQVVSLSKK